MKFVHNKVVMVRLGDSVINAERITYASVVNEGFEYHPEWFINVEFDDTCRSDGEPLKVRYKTRKQAQQALAELLDACRQPMIEEE